MNARYYEGAAGRRYFYSSTLTIRCPYAEGAPDWLVGEVWAAPENGRDADGLDLSRVFRFAHEYKARHERADPDDPSRCRACGATLERVGYYAWVEEPWPSEAEIRREMKGQPEEKVSMALTSRTVNMRLGGTHRRVPGSQRYFPRKTGEDGAVAWAREKASTERWAVREDQKAGAT